MKLLLAKVALLICFSILLQSNLLAAGTNKFYTRGSGDWNDPNTWSNIDFGSDYDPATTIPGPGDSVYIGQYNTIYVTANASAYYVNISTVATLEIAEGMNLTIDDLIDNYGSINIVGSLTSKNLTNNYNGYTYGGGDLRVSDNLINQYNSQFVMEGPVMVDGDITNYGTFTTKRVIFSNPLRDQYVKGVYSFEEIHILKTAGSLFIQNDVSVKSIFLGGLLDMSNYTLTFEAGISTDGAPYGPSNMIRFAGGKLKVNVSESAPLVGLTFPLGTKDGYTPFVIDKLDLVSPGYSFIITPLYSDKTTAFSFVKNYFNLSTLGIESVSDFQFRYGFEPTGMVGTPVVVSHNGVKVDQGFVDTDVYGVNQSGNIEIDGDWVAAEILEPTTYFAIENGDWNDVNTWKDIFGQQGVPRPFDDVVINRDVEVLVNAAAGCGSIAFEEFDGHESKLKVLSGSTLTVLNNLDLFYPLETSNSSLLTIENGAQVNVGEDFNCNNVNAKVIIDGQLDVSGAFNNYGNIIGAGDVFIGGAFYNGESGAATERVSQATTLGVYDINGTTTFEKDMQNLGKILSAQGTFVFSSKEIDQYIYNYGTISVNEVKVDKGNYILYFSGGSDVQVNRLQLSSIVNVQGGSLLTLNYPYTITGAPFGRNNLISGSVRLYAEKPSDYVGIELPLGYNYYDSKVSGYAYEYTPFKIEKLSALSGYTKPQLTLGVSAPDSESQTKGFSLLPFLLNTTSSGFKASDFQFSIGFNKDKLTNSPNLVLNSGDIISQGFVDLENGRYGIDKVGNTLVNGDWVVGVTPVIESFSPLEACPGETISIIGSGFLPVTKVEFNGQTIENIFVYGDNEIYFTVPSNPVSGKIKVLNTLSETDLIIKPHATVSVVEDSICSNDPLLNISAVFGGTATGVNWTADGYGVFADDTNNITTYTADGEDIARGYVFLTATTRSKDQSCNNYNDRILVNFPSSISVDLGPDTDVCNSDLGTSIELKWPEMTVGYWDRISGTNGNGSLTEGDVSLFYILGEGDENSDSIKVWMNVGGACDITDTMSIYIDHNKPVEAADITVCDETKVIYPKAISDTKRVSWYHVYTHADYYVGSFDNNEKLEPVYTVTNDEIAFGSFQLGVNTKGCGNSKTLNVDFKPVQIDAGEYEDVCSGSTITLGGDISGRTSSGKWSGGKGFFVPNANTLTAKYIPTNTEKLNGSLKLTLTTIESGICASESDESLITFATAPYAFAGSNGKLTAQGYKLSGNVSNADGGIWTSSGTGIFSPSDTALDATYIPSQEDLTKAKLILTLTTTGNGSCNEYSSSLILTSNAVACNLTTKISYPEIEDNVVKFEVFNDDITTPGSYIWDLGNGESAPGREQSYIYQEPGNYIVSVTYNAADASCSAYRQDTITVNKGASIYSIKGEVNAGANVLDRGVLTLFKFDAKHYTMLRTKELTPDANGSYEFNNLGEGYYLVFCIPQGQSEAYNKYLATYYGGAEKWIDANFIHITDADFNEAAIQLLPFVMPTRQPGSGAIKGTIVFSELISNARTTEGASEPVEYAVITLYNSSGDRLTSTYTDPFGNYSFDDLVSGEYTIEVEYAGASMIEKVDLNVQDGKVEDGSTSISRETVTVGNVDKIAYFTANLYPNPAIDNVTIALPFSGSDEMEIGVFNALGNKVSTIKTSASNALTISVKDLTTGFYILEATSEGRIFRAKFEKL